MSVQLLVLTYVRNLLLLTDKDKVEDLCKDDIRILKYSKIDCKDIWKVNMINVDSVYVYILERSSQVIIFLLKDGTTCHREQNLYYIFQYANLSCIASYYDKKISKSTLLIFFGNLTLFRIFLL